MPALRISGTSFSSMSCSLAAHRTGHHAALAVEVLGARVDDQVGAELRPAAAAPVCRSSCRPPAARPPRGRSRPARAMSHTSVNGLLGVSANSSFVFGLHRALPFADVGLRHERGLDAELARTRGRSSTDRRAEHALRADHVIAGLQQPQARAAGSRPCRWTVAMQASRAFERGQAALHHHHRRIGEARVDEGLLFVGEARRGRGRIGMHEAAGQEQRLGVLAPLAGRQALAHGERVQAQHRRAVRRAAGSSSVPPSGCSVAPCSASRERRLFLVALRRRAARRWRRTRRREMSPVM